MNEETLWAFLGGFAVFCGLGLAFVQVDRDDLSKRAQSNPMLALYRFRIFRWGMVVVCLLAGVTLLGAGLGFWRV